MRAAAERVIVRQINADEGIDVTLLEQSELPSDFQYPPGFLRLVRLGLVHLEPWWVLEGDDLRRMYRGLRTRYPHQAVVPFARRQNNDDVACFTTDGTGVVRVIHDFAGPGYEVEEEFPSVYDWFKSAVEDLVNWGA